MKKLLTIIGIVSILGLLSFAFPNTLAITGADAENEITVQDDNDSSSAQADEETKTAAGNGISKFFRYSGFANATPGHLVMLLVV